MALWFFLSCVLHFGGWNNARRRLKLPYLVSPLVGWYMRNFFIQIYVTQILSVFILKRKWKVEIPSVPNPYNVHCSMLSVNLSFFTLHFWMTSRNVPSYFIFPDSSSHLNWKTMLIQKLLLHMDLDHNLSILYHCVCKTENKLIFMKNGQALGSATRSANTTYEMLCDLC